ncbi:MAG: hypothetical protein DMF63_00695 [Acidobacteria bacterium]|nr:MAG: hypothetical protein DMF63_00695 [Acidobacteriota bacterium]
MAEMIVFRACLSVSGKFSMAAKCCSNALLTKDYALLAKECKCLARVYELLTKDYALLAKVYQCPPNPCATS